MIKNYSKFSKLTKNKKFYYTLLLLALATSFIIKTVQQETISLKESNSLETSNKEVITKTSNEIKSISNKTTETTHSLMTETTSAVDDVLLVNPNSNINENNTLNKNTCHVNKDCSDDFICDLDILECIHKDFLPIYPKQFFSLLLICLTCAFATSIGIGGGSVIATILMSIDNFDPKEAVPISIIIILFCSITTFFMGAKAKVDYNDYNFVDYDIVLVCCPLVLFGVKIGTILNIALPNSIILICLTALLVHNCFRSYKNANIYKEREEKESKHSQLLESNVASFQIDKACFTLDNTYDKTEEKKESFYSDKDKFNNKINNINQINNKFSNNNDLSKEDLDIAYSVYTNPRHNKNSEMNINTSNIPDYVSVRNNYPTHLMKQNNIDSKLKKKLKKDDFNLPALLEFRKKRTSNLNLIKAKENKDNNNLSDKDIQDNKELDNNNQDSNKDNLFVSEEKLHDNNFNENNKFEKYLSNKDEDSDTIKEDEEALEELISKIKEIEIIKSDILYENSPIRLNRLRTLLEFICLLLFMEMLLGNKNIDSIVGIKICSSEFFIILVIFGFISFAISHFSFENIKKEEEISDIFSSVLLSPEQMLNKEKQFHITKLSNNERLKLYVYSLGTGLIASTCGVGGGIIMCPLFIELGVNPKIAASSSNLLVIVSSLSSSILYLVLNRIKMDYSIVYCGLTTISAILGNWIINDYINKTKKISFLVFVLFYLTVFSLILLPINGLIIIQNEYDKYGSYFQLHNLCQAFSK